MSYILDEKQLNRETDTLIEQVAFHKKITGANALLSTVVFIGSLLKPNFLMSIALSLNLTFTSIVLYTYFYLNNKRGSLLESFEFHLHTEKPKGRWGK